MKLIDNWQKAWRMYSVIALTVITTIQGALASLPPGMESLPMLGSPWTYAQVGAVLTMTTALTVSVKLVLAVRLPSLTVRVIVAVPV